MLSSRHVLNNVVLVTRHLLTRQRRHNSLFVTTNKYSNFLTKIRNHSGITIIRINYSWWSPQYIANLCRPQQFPGRYALRKRNVSSSRSRETPSPAVRSLYLQGNSPAGHLHLLHPRVSSSARHLVNRSTLGDISHHTNGSLFSLFHFNNGSFSSNTLSVLLQCHPQITIEMIQNLETLENKSANYEPFAEPFIAGAGTVCAEYAGFPCNTAAML